MTGRSPARLLAPLALVAIVLALVLVVSSGGGVGSGAPEGVEDRPATTTTENTADGEEEEKPRKRKTYTVKAGDTPSSIAEKTKVPLDRLLELNPDVDPQLLSPGQKLKLQ